MIRINLLPFRAARRKENVRRQITVFFLSLLVIAALLVYGNSYLGGMVEDINGKVNTTRAALAAKKKQANEVDRIEEQLELLKKKTEVIINLALNRKESVLLVDNLTKMIVEKRMWFTSMDTVQNALDIRGVALDNKTVADFMTRLEKSEFFKDVRLQSTKKQKIGDYDNLKSFTITMSKVPLSELVKKKEEAKKS